MNQCPSVFLGNHCGRWEGHDGNHAHVDRTDYTVRWDDNAADKEIPA